MGIFDKIADAMKITDEEEFEDEEFYDEYEDDYEDVKPSSRRSSYMKNRKSYDDIDDYQDDVDDYRDSRSMNKNRSNSGRSNSRSENSDRIVRQDRPERSERTDRYEKFDRNVNIDKPEKQESHYEARQENTFTQEKPADKAVFNKKSAVKKSSGEGMGVCVIRPTAVEDSRDIVDKLLGNRTVVLNLEGLDIDVAQRIIDFTSGACYAISGNLQKISQYIFLLTPSNVDISGDINNLIGEGMSSYDN